MRLWTKEELIEKDKEPIFVLKECSECGMKDFDFLIEIGQPHECDSLTTFVCILCLKKAVGMADGGCNCEEHAERAKGRTLDHWWICPQHGYKRL